MDILRHSRLILWWGLILVLLSNCSQENSLDTDPIQAEAYLDVAQVYFEQGQFRSALIETQNALQLVPGHTRGVMLLAEINMEIGNLTDAIEVLEIHLDNGQQSSEGLLLLADAYLRAGNPTQSISLLESVQLQNSEADIRMLTLRGSAYANLDELQQAEQSFQQALELDSQEVDALIGLSKLAYQNGNIDQSSDYLNQAIATDPSNLDLWIWRGSFAMLNNNFPDAENAYFEALELMSNYDLMTAKRFSVLQSILVPLQLQQKNEEALRYSEIIAASPQGQIQNTYNRALSLYEQRDFDRAEIAVNQILEINATHLQGNLLLGFIKYEIGDYEQATVILEDYAPLANASSLPIRILAASYVRQNQPQNALNALQSVSDFFNEDATFYTALGTTQAVLGNYEAAIEALTTARSLNQEDPEILYLLAGSYYAVGDSPNAISVLNESIEQFPESAAGARTLLSLYLNEGDIDVASERIQELIAANPESPELQILAGQVAMFSGNSNLARQYFETGNELDASNTGARLNLARIAMIDQDYQLAAENFESVLQREPTNIDALRGLLALGQMNNSEAQQIRRIIEVSDQYPNSSIAPMVLAQFYLSSGDFDQALDHAQESMEREDNTDTRNTIAAAFHGMATTQSQSGNYQEALATIDRALEIQENAAVTLAFATSIAIENSDLDRAQSYTDQIRSLEGDSAMVMEIEGDLLVARQELDAALSSYRQAWSLNISSSLGGKLYRLINSVEGNTAAKLLLDEWLAAFPEDGNVNTLLGIHYQSTSQSENAISHYETALAQQPNRAVVLNNLAWLYQDSNPERALSLSTRAYELLPDNADILDTYGWILYRQGDTDRALEILRRASEIAPDSELIREHLSEVLQ